MDDQWYVGRNGQKSGPYTTAQLRQLAAAGQLATGDLLWKPGLAEWVPMTKVRGLLPANAGGTLPPLELQRQDPQGLEPRLFAGDPADAIDVGVQVPQAQAVGGVRNPYAAGAAIPLGDTSAVAPAAYADFLPRVGATLLDGLFMTILTLALQGGVPALCHVLFGMRDEALGAAMLLGWLVSVCLSILYYVGYESSARQGTWGKQIAGIKVTDMHGRRITVGRALGRFFAKFLTNMTCGIGHLLPLFTERKQTLHDLLCGCLALRR